MIQAKRATTKPLRVYTANDRYEKVWDTVVTIFGKVQQQAYHTSRSDCSRPVGSREAPRLVQGLALCTVAYDSKSGHRLRGC